MRMKAFYSEARITSMAKNLELPNNQMIFTVEQLRDMEYSNYLISQMVGKGMLQKLTKKSYRNCGYVGNVSEFYYVPAYAPQGVVCSLSAAYFHGLINETPPMVHVAIPRKSKISTLPEWPIFDVSYYTDARYETDIQIVVEGGNQFFVYSEEKTVTDLVYYKERIGSPIVEEILNVYVEKSNREKQIQRLKAYAERMNCLKRMEACLEVIK
jgi:predicted transcriptional regulator of viral defense system